MCTANICRSPTAEYLARNRFGERSAVFRSVGFLRSDDACPSTLVDVMARRGVDLRSHRSYRVDRASIDAAELLLTMEGEHVQRLTLLDRGAFTRIIPLTEAAAALPRLPPGSGIDGLMEVVNRERDPSTYLSDRWDVADPYGQKRRDYEQAVDQITDLVASLGAALGWGDPDPR
ncbi:MAG: hypothetical protein ACK5PP_09995 [Acidimicrobiales bacterium]